MAVKLLFNGIPQFLNPSTGAPYTGARLFFYASGSSTKQTTYTTSAGSVGNSNPMVANSSGFMTTSSSITEIWGTVGQSYKVGLAAPGSDDPPASFIWVADGVTPINDTTVTVDQWVSGPAPQFIGATSFSLVGDQTSAFHVGRRLKTTNTGGTIYSTITASVFAASTTVTVVNDSGSLDSGLSAVSYSLLTANVSALPHTKSDSTGLMFQNAVNMEGKISLSGDITPTQIAANTNNYNPTGLSTATILRLSSDASRNITGLQGGSDGRILVLFNVGSNDIVLKTGDANSDAANRFGFDADFVLVASSTATIFYDSTASLWRMKNPLHSKKPVRTVYTSGSGTHTTAAGTTRILARLRGGASSGSVGGATPTAGNAGAATTFGALTANGGNAAVTAGSNVPAAATASGGDINIVGATATVSVNTAVSNSGTDGAGDGGGGGGSGGGAPAASGAGAPNSGAGGGGGGSGGATAGSGGNQGAYCEKLFTTISATYAYAVGAGGAAVTGNATCSASGAGGSGIIIVDEFFD